MERYSVVGDLISTLFPSKDTTSFSNGLEAGLAGPSEDHTPSAEPLMVLHQASFPAENLVALPGILSCRGSGDPARHPLLSQVWTFFGL